MRTSFLLITLLLTNSLALAVPTAKDSKKMEKLPPFVNPLKLAKFIDDDSGKVSVKDGDVCYNDPAHTKLTVFLQNVKPASDLRALQSFNEGYLDGYEKGAKRTLDLKTQSELSTFSEILQNKILWFAIGASSSLILVELFK